MHGRPSARVMVVLLATLALGGCAASEDATTGGERSARGASATCGEHATQADAQAAADTRDTDGDGVYCETNPCPCSGPLGDGPRPGPTPGADPNTAADRRRPAAVRPGDPARCAIVPGVVRVGLSRTRYPQVREHWDRAIAAGWPRVLRVNRAGAARRRAALLRGVPSRPGLDRDEYPMAMARAGVGAHVALVPAAQNRGAGSVQGIKLRRYCSGQRFTVVWY